MYIPDGLYEFNAMPFAPHFITQLQRLKLVLTFLTNAGLQLNLSLAASQLTVLYVLYKAGVLPNRANLRAAAEFSKPDVHK